MKELPLSLLLLAVAPAVPAQPPQTSKLNGPLVAGGDVISFKTSADGPWVVYLADEEVDQQFDLYRVAASGGTAIQVSADLPLGGDVSQYEIAPDGSRAVYLADQELDGHLDVYSVLLADGSRVKLSDPNFTAQAGAFLITPDSTRVVFREAGTLYVEPIGGGARIALGSGSPLAITPDSTRLIYTDTTGELRYRSVPLAGGSPILIYDPPNDASSTLFTQPSPDSSRLLFAQGQFTAPPSFRYHALYSSTLSAGTPHLYYAVTGSCCSIEFGGVTPVPVAGAHRVVWANNDASGDLTQELYSEELEGGTEVVLAVIPFPNPILAQVSADPGTVLYRGGRLFSVPVAGGASLDLSGTLTPGGTITDFTSSQDAVWAVYRADQIVDEVFDLHATPMAGGNPDNLTDSTGSTDVQPDFALASGSNAVVYRADPLVDEQYDLHAVAIVGGPTLRLSNVSVSGGDVIEDGWSITGGARHLVYMADQELDEVVELFTAALRTACSGGLTEEDGDSVCTLDNCPTVHNPDQLDGDGDGAGDRCDCAPADPGESRPDEVPGVLVERSESGAARLSWSSTSGADTYAVTRGSLGALAVGQYGDCVVTGLTDTTYDDLDDPGAGDGFAYLIEGVGSACGAGGLGHGAGGERINQDPQACYAP